MAKFTIDRLNYMTTGRNRIFLNVDRKLAKFPGTKTTLVKREEDDTLVSLEDGKTILKTDDYMDSDAYREWLELYRIRNTNKNVTFDLERDQQNENINRLESFHPMYDMVDIHVKSALENKKDNFQKFDDSANQCEDLYNPDMDDNPVEFCKVGQKTYMMTTPTVYESQILDIDFQSKGTGTYYIPKFEEKLHETVLLNPISSLSMEDGSQVSSLSGYFEQFSGNSATLQKKIDQYFYGTRQISGISYNHLLGLHHKNAKRWSTEKNMTDYRNGNVYADIFSLKNTYDSTYSMYMDSPTTIKNCREYCGVMESRDKVYLKYRDDVRFSVNSAGDTVRGVPSRRTWQKIETMEPASVGYQAQARHKSNYFSIRMNSTGLAEDGHELDMVKKDIENSIRNIAQKFAPANTQLFEIQIED